jgi:hypothetical protein
LFLLRDAAISADTPSSRHIYVSLLNHLEQSRKDTVSAEGNR